MEKDLVIHSACRWQSRNIRDYRNEESGPQCDLKASAPLFSSISIIIVYGRRGYLSRESYVILMWNLMFAVKNCPFDSSWVCASPVRISIVTDDELAPWCRNRTHRSNTLEYLLPQVYCPCGKAFYSNEPLAQNRTQRQVPKTNILYARCSHCLPQGHLNKECNARCCRSDTLKLLNTNSQRHA